MRMRILVVSLLLLGSTQQHAFSQATQSEQNETSTPPHFVVVPLSSANADAVPAALTPEQLTKLIFPREKEVQAEILRSKPIVETYIQRTKKDESLGLATTHDFYFLGQADFSKHIRLLPIVQHPKSGNLLWSFEPRGFLFMAFPDLGGFNQANY
jgi:hypothetical protein